MLLVEVQKLGASNRYGIEKLHKSGRNSETKSQKVLGTNPHIYRSYRGKPGRGLFWLPYSE